MTTNQGHDRSKSRLLSGASFAARLAMSVRGTNPITDAPRTIVIAHPHPPITRSYASWLDSFDKKVIVATGSELTIAIHEHSTFLVICDQESLAALCPEFESGPQSSSNQPYVLLASKSPTNPIDIRMPSSYDIHYLSHEDELAQRITQIQRRHQYVAMVDTYFQQVYSNLDAMESMGPPNLAATTPQLDGYRPDVIQEELSTLISTFDESDFEALFRSF